MSSFSTIACCIDLTEQNDDIVSYTREMAELTGAKLLLVHVLPPTGAFASYGASRELLQKVAAESRQETEKYVKEFAEKYMALPVIVGHQIDIRDGGVDLVQVSRSVRLLAGRPGNAPHILVVGDCSGPLLHVHKLVGVVSELALRRIRLR